MSVMHSTTADPSKGAAEPRSVGAALLRGVERWGPRIALRRRREPLQWSVLTWTEMGQQVRALAAGLLAMGVKPGDRVGLVSNTRLEWTLVDYAILSAGAVTVPVYHSSPAGQLAWILRDSGASVVFVEDRGQWEKLKGRLPELLGVRRAVLLEVMDLRNEPQAMLLDELLRDGRRHLRESPGELDRTTESVGPQDLATLVYTSGTTGKPKGVRLSHGNLLAAVRALRGVLPVGPDDTTVLCLPLTHIYARLGQFAALDLGFCIAFAQRVDLLQEVLAEVRPSFFFAVPRIYERIYHRVVTGYRELPPLLQTAVKRGVEATRASLGLPRTAAGNGAAAGGAEEAGVEPSQPAPGEAPRGPLRSLTQRLADRAWERVADKTVFQPVREALGGRVRFCVSGGAPMNLEVARFFRMAGIEVLEGYGLTETVGAATINPPGENRLGTVGRPLPGVRIRIAADGEILIRGDVVFDGYHEQPEETAMALLEDGWLATGDVGAIDEAGHLVITDRKKDLVITSSGKNISPAQVEAALRSSPYLADVMVFGDRRPYLVALVSLQAEELQRFASSVELPTDDFAALLREPSVQKLLDAEVERCNQRLAPFERVRRYRVLPRGLSIEGGELTPTLKVRRREVEERYRPLIEAMYAELPPA